MRADPGGPYTVLELRDCPEAEQEEEDIDLGGNSFQVVSVMRREIRCWSEKEPMDMGGFYF